MSAVTPRIDKLIYKDADNVWIVYSHRTPVHVHTDNGTAIKLVEYLLEPKIQVDFQTYLCYYEISKQDTNPCFTGLHEHKKEAA